MQLKQSVEVSTGATLGDTCFDAHALPERVAMLHTHLCIQRMDHTIPSLCRCGAAAATWRMRFTTPATKRACWCGRCAFICSRLDFLPAKASAQQWPGCMLLELYHSHCRFLFHTLLQEAMFACAPYPADDAFLREVASAFICCRLSLMVAVQLVAAP